MDQRFTSKKTGQSLGGSTELDWTGWELLGSPFRNFQQPLESVGFFFGTPKDMGPLLFPNPTPIFESLKIWGMVWVLLTIRGSHHWEFVESPLKESSDPLSGPVFRKGWFLVQ